MMRAAMTAGQCVLGTGAIRSRTGSHLVASMLRGLPEAHAGVVDANDLHVAGLDQPDAA